jgi:hypothetical protein
MDSAATRGMGWACWEGLAPVTGNHTRDGSDNVSWHGRTHCGVLDGIGVFSGV